MPESATTAKAAAPAAAPDPLRELERGVARVRGEIALYWLGFAIEILAAGVLTYAVAWGVADVLWDLAPGTHRVLRALFFGLTAAAAAGLAVLVRRRMPDRGTIATRMEAREPAFEGSLLAAVQALEEPDGVPAAVAWISAQRAAEVLRVTGAAPVRPRVRRTPLHLWLFGAMIAVLAAAGLFGPRFFQAFLRGFLPEDPAVFAPELALEVRPGNVAVAEGDSVAVEALLHGDAAAAVVLQVRDEDGEAGPAPEERALERDASASDTQSERWAGALGIVSKPRAYRVVAYVRDPGRVMPWTFASPWFRAEPVRRARLLGLDVLVEPPAYSGNAPRLWKDPERVQVLARSTVTVLARAAPARDLGAGMLSAPGGLELPMNRMIEDGGEAAYRAGFVADRPGALRLRIEPAPGREGAPEAALLLELVQDLPPEAEAAIPEGAEIEAPGLPVHLRLADDIGLVSARLVVKALPAGEGGDPAVAGKELSYKIPLDGSPKKVQERWYLPAQGLGGLLARGFAYRVEATDGARPLAQTTQSPWQRWAPGAGDSAPQNGMLERQGRRGRRQLARKDAFSKIPDLTPEQLAQLGAQGGLGGAGPGGGPGEDRPKELVRPKAERLEGRDPADLGGDDADGGGQDGGKDRAHDNKGGGGEGTGQGQGKGKGEREGQGNGNGMGEGERGSGEAGAGNGASGGGGGGGAAGADGGSGNYERPEGLSQDAQGKRGGQGGGGGSSRGGSGQGGTGDGGAREGPAPRDGGLKTGHERGRSSPEMTPPDLETLARMKGCSLDEAKAYAQRAGIEVTDTGFGKEGGAERVMGVSESNDRRDGSFDLQTPQALPAAKKAPEKAAPKPPPAPGAVRFEEIEPLYRPWVQGYFRHLRE